MKREKYRYDQYPQEGIAGINRDLALELACREVIRGQYFISIPLYYTSEVHDDFDRVISGSSFVEDYPGFIDLLSDTLYELDMAGQAVLSHLKAPWDPLFPDDAFKVRPANGAPSDFVSSDRKIILKRENVVFNVAEIERYAEKNSPWIVDKPKTVASPDERLLAMAKNTKNSCIRSMATLQKAKDYRALFEVVQKQEGQPTQAESIEEVRNKLSLGLNEKPPSADTIRKSIASLNKLEAAVHAEK